MHSYGKRTCKSFGMHSYKFIGLKVSWNELLQENPVGGLPRVLASPPSLLDGQHNLADVLAGVDVAVGFGSLLEGKHFADDGFDLAGGGRHLFIPLAIARRTERPTDCAHPTTLGWELGAGNRCQRKASAARLSPQPDGQLPPPLLAQAQQLRQGDTM